MDNWPKCTDCSETIYSNYGSDTEPLCGECHLKHREAKRQALWDASSQRSIDLTGQVLWQRVTEADDWDASDDAVGQVWERVVILESRVSWYDNSSRIIVAHFRLGSGVEIYALGQRKQKGVPTLSEATQKRLHQAMSAWYADTTPLLAGDQLPAEVEPEPEPVGQCGKCNGNLFWTDEDRFAVRCAACHKLYSAARITGVVEPEPDSPESAAESYGEGVDYAPGDAPVGYRGPVAITDADVPDLDF